MIHIVGLAILFVAFIALAYVAWGKVSALTQSSTAQSAYLAPNSSQSSAPALSLPSSLHSSALCGINVTGNTSEFVCTGTDPSNQSKRWNFHIDLSVGAS